MLMRKSEGYNEMREDELCKIKISARWGVGIWVVLRRP